MAKEASYLPSTMKVIRKMERKKANGGFDESKHPRVPKGSGDSSGEFTSAGSRGVASRMREDLRRMGVPKSHLANPAEYKPKPKVHKPKAAKPLSKAALKAVMSPAASTVMANLPPGTRHAIVGSHVRVYKTGSMGRSSKK